MFQGLVNWLLGTLLCIVSLAGLFIAAKGSTSDAYAFGLGLAFLSLACLGVLVRNALDKADHH
ncbi:MAG: hypothetical protein EB059_08455 [Alphaproteobacteria bacterium]|nr:hypothetical protein [Alphaproteobacteria bacterium]